MNFKILLSTIISLALINNSVLAIPGVPNQFYGSVSLNGQPAPDGTTIVAIVNGVQVASTTTSNGKYGYNPTFFVTDPNNDRSGKTITFFVNGVDTGQTSIFCNGCSTNLDLFVTIAQPPSGSSGGGPGGSGGGVAGNGGGGGVAGGTIGGTVGGTNQSTQTTTQQACQEKWICSDWSECEDGIQRRTCNDENNCETNNNEPLTAQPCIVKQQVTPPSQSRSILTGMFVGITQNPVYIIVLGLVVAIIAFLFKTKIQFKKRK